MQPRDGVLKDLPRICGGGRILGRAVLAPQPESFFSKEIYGQNPRVVPAMTKLSVRRKNGLGPRNDENVSTAFPGGESGKQTGHFTSHVCWMTAPEPSLQLQGLLRQPLHPSPSPGAATPSPQQKFSLSVPDLLLSKHFGSPNFHALLQRVDPSLSLHPSQLPPFAKPPSF